MNQIKIITILNAVRQCNDSRFREALQRFSNNNRPKFSDDELIAICIWGKYRHLSTKKAVYDVIKECKHSMFPNLPSYQAFCRRANRIESAFRIFGEVMMARQDNVNFCEYVIDSCPIMLAKHCYANTAKVAKEFCYMCHNSTRNEWYYGVKLHVIGKLRKGKLPEPCSLIAARANLCDLWAAKEIVSNYQPISNGVLYADRAYIDAEWAKDLQAMHNIHIITPRKKQKGDAICSEDIYSTQVSAKRQPIEAYFSWLNFYTNIEDAHFVRSKQGLLFHIFLCIAAGCLLMRFNY